MPRMPRILLTFLLGAGLTVGVLPKPATADCCWCPYPAIYSCTGLEARCFCECGFIGLIPVTLTYSGGTHQAFYFTYYDPEVGCPLEECEVIGTGKSVVVSRCLDGFTTSSSNGCVTNPSCNNDCPSMIGPVPSDIAFEECPY